MTGQYISAEQASAFDDFTINQIGVPSAVLMEKAALAVYDRLLKSPAFNLKKVLVIAGSGNNGGDGIAVARLLYLRGIPVTIWLLGQQDKASVQTQLQLKIVKNYGLPIENQIDEENFSKYTCLVDAIFGVGLSREIEGNYAQAVNRINASTAAVMAVDIPSGLHADDGKVLGTSVQADETVTMSYNKMAMATEQGRQLAGLVTVADIGIYDPNCLPAN
ncbi:NAD(P)H-hydrate epimerase [Oenococcus kitaharae]|nr:NAD(P)H-hydrate epimerase [Oenococcus kitaharae]OEY83600.1 carbohydrate kinase [Oenococcus kitaharae]OEY85398.1 carbohydrate kinase [Oenococcus kitaharae]OEY86251.1 carbohydrate kinase [Oenococcus kitaharae]